MQPFYVLAKKCPFGNCTNVTELTVSAAAYDLWEEGAVPIQVAFPDLTPEQREFVKSGFCKPHMDLIFAPPED